MAGFTCANQNDCKTRLVFVSLRKGLVLGWTLSKVLLRYESSERLNNGKYTSIQYRVNSESA